MGVQKFELCLDNPQGVYFPGAVVTGNLNLWLDKRTNFRSIIVFCQGDSKVYWTESGTDNDSTIHSTTVPYFHLYRIIKGKENGERTELGDGHYSFPFEFILPDGLPSSFEGKYGSVRYMVKAKMDRPWYFSSGSKTLFTVNSVVKLDSYPHLLEPVTLTDHTHVCCLFCRSGVARVEIVLRRSGYVPGDVLDLFVMASNKINARLQIKMKLIETITYKVKKEKTEEKRYLIKADVGDVEPLNDKAWDIEEFVVPPTAPTGLPFCDIIDTTHVLLFTVKSDALFSSSMDMSLNLKIGTIPYRQRFSLYHRYDISRGVCDNACVPLLAKTVESSPSNLPNYQTAAGSGIGGSDLFDDVHFSAAVPNYPGLPPPRYEECLFGSDYLRDEDDGEYMKYPDQFSPKYATYSPREQRKDS